MPKPKGLNNKVRVCMSITPDIKRLLSEVAWDKRLCLSVLIEQYCVECLKKEGKL